MIAFLEALHEAKHPDKPKKEKKRRAPKFMVYHSLEMKAFVVWLRYGTLSEEVQPTLRTYSQIFHITGVKISSQFIIIRLWKENGHQVVCKRSDCGRRTYITQEMKQYLLSTQTLKEWAPFSLFNRTLKIEQKFGIKLHYTTLSNFYRRNKVTCRKPQYQYGRKQE